MTNEQILRKAIAIAQSNGWKGEVLWNSEKPVEYLAKSFIFNHDFSQKFWGERKIRLVGYYYWCEGYIDNEITIKEYNKLSDEEKEDKGWARYDKKYEVLNEGWQHHLQNMVLKKEPLKYIEKFL